MKNTTIKIFILFFLFKIDCYAQSEYYAIDNFVKEISFIESESLATKLTENYDTDLEKVRAIFFWISNNIEYDLPLSKDQNQINKLYTSAEDIVRHTLKSKKAICSGYSYLFQSMCDEVGIESVVINGFSRQIFDGFKEKLETDHAWNAVKIDNEWYFLDSTWASGNTVTGQFVKEFNGFWFLTDPEEFIYTHYPEDSKWTLLDREFTKNDFYRLPTLNGNFFFTNGTKIIEPKSGIISVDSTNKFRIEIELKNENTNVWFAGYPGETYATLNNLPEPTDDDYEKYPDRYSLIVPSFEIVNEEKNGKRVIYTFEAKHKSLKGLWISIDYVQTAEYKIEWE